MLGLYSSTLAFNAALFPKLLDYTSTLILKGSRDLSDKKL